MAESSSIVNRQLLFEADTDTPVPAAEALVSLKSIVNHVQQRNSTHSSPLHKRKNNTCHKNQSYKRGLRRFEESEEEDKDVDSFSPPQKKSKRIQQKTNNSHQQPIESDVQIWKKPIRTFLRLPKALSWCRYEWFCSDIDRVFLGGENDFSQCLNELFPNLKTRTLTAIQWRVIRRLVGKPRRCSRVFFAEERSLLEEKRKRVRDIQKKIHQGALTLTDFNHLQDLPDNIPTVLTVGTKVTAFLCVEKDKGFHTGTVEAVDLDKSQYWIAFDKPDIGKHSVADTDVQSLLTCEYVSLSSLKAGRQLASSASLPPPTHQTQLLPDSEHSGKISSHNPEVPDPLLPSSPLISRGRLTSEQNTEQSQQSLGGFPTDLLRQVVEMSKLLGLKQDRVRRISMLNKEAEKMHARHVPLTLLFQKQYATIVIDLDDINRQLNLRSEAVKKYCSELGYEDEPYQLSNSQECLQHAQEIISSSNERLRSTGSEVTSTGTLTLISKLTSLLLQIELLSQVRRSHDLSGLQVSINETLNSIHTDNHKIFKKHIETPLTLIQSGMNPSDSLHPFSVTVAKKPLVRTASNNVNSCTYSPRRLK